MGGQGRIPKMTANGTTRIAFSTPSHPGHCLQPTTMVSKGQEDMLRHPCVELTDTVSKASTSKKTDPWGELIH